MTLKSKFLLTALCAAFLMSAAVTAQAQNANVVRPEASDLMPQTSPENLEIHTGDVRDTHPPVRLTPDKSELITLDADASSVIVGNPTHLGVLLDTSRVLVLVPRAPGASSFTVLDQDRNVLMQRQVIVGSPKETYIRVRRSCANAEDDRPCQATSVYYCPDMCHEVGVTQLQARRAEDDEEDAE